MTVGNVAVDMCFACIEHNRERNQPLVAIELNWVYYAIFQNWVQLNYSQEMAMKQFSIHGVDILKSKNRTDKTIKEIWANK